MSPCLVIHNLYMTLSSDTNKINKLFAAEKNKLLSGVRDKIRFDMSDDSHEKN